MEIVLDTNILISSLLKDGLTRKIIFLSPFEMFTVEYSRSEIEVHREELLRKSKLDERSFDYLIEIIFSRINLVPMKELEPQKRIAEEIMHDIDLNDTPLWLWHCT
jgi:predicted nucleic acid-binding protein